MIGARMASLNRRRVKAAKRAWKGRRIWGRAIVTAPAYLKAQRQLNEEFRRGLDRIAMKGSR